MTKWNATTMGKTVPSVHCKFSWKINSVPEGRSNYLCAFCEIKGNYFICSLFNCNFDHIPMLDHSCEYGISSHFDRTRSWSIQVSFMVMLIQNKNKQDSVLWLEDENAIKWISEFELTHYLNFSFTKTKHLFNCLQINSTVHADIYARVICVLSLLSTGEVHAKPGNKT